MKDGFWFTRNIDEMADIAGTAKVFIDADSSTFDLHLYNSQ